MRLNKLIQAVPALLLATAVAAVPLAAQSELIKLEATASYYGDEFHGRTTSSGEIFDMNALTAAHKTLPFGTLLEVTNLENGKKVIVRVNDRGPFVADRELDVSKAAAIQLGMLESGIARVSIRKIGSSNTAPATTPQTAAPAAPGATIAPTIAPTRAVSPESFAAEPEVTVFSAPADAVGPASTAGAANPAAKSATAPAANTVSAEPAEAATTVAPAASAAPAESAATIVAVTAPNLAAQGSGIQWRIQLGSFSREENASRLVVRLRKDGFNPGFEKSGTLIRVVLAGIPDSELKVIRSRLDAAGYGEYLVRQETW